MPWVTQKVLRGEMVTFSKLTDLPPEAGRDRLADQGAVSQGRLQRRHVLQVACTVRRVEVADAKRLRELEAENGKLKKLLAEAHLDMHALKSVLGVKR